MLTLEGWNSLRGNYGLRPLGSDTFSIDGEPPTKTRKMEDPGLNPTNEEKIHVENPSMLSTNNVPVGFHTGTVHRVKPDGSGQVRLLIF